MKRLAILFSWSLLVASTSTGAERLAVLEVSAGSHERVDTPVSAELPASVNAWREMRLLEVRGEERTSLPYQVEAGSPPRIWWVLKGTTPAGEKRGYELVRGQPVQADGVDMKLTSRRLEVSVQGSPLFSYNHAHVIPPKGIKPEFIRSGYIHPLFSPTGDLITEDFPADHHHHKGIWFPWTKTKFEGRDIDFWNLGGKTGTVQFAGFRSLESGPVYGRFRVNHEHIDLTQPNGGKVALNEVWDVRIWAETGETSSYRIFDLTSTQRCASGSPLELLKYRYGGIGYRGPREWKKENYVLLTSEGKTKKNGHTTRAKWCAHSGAIDGKWTTVVIMCHPSNERFPEPMRIWPSGGAFFNFAPVQAGDWTLEPGKDYNFRYRFFIHQGKIDRDRAERIWQDFADPPEATCKNAGES